MFDPAVIPFVAHAMHALKLAVATGSYFYVSISVPADKAQAVVQLWHERYELDLNKHQRHYRRKKGQAVFSLIVFPHANSTELQLYLLRTEGRHPCLALETWRDARCKQTRMQWLHSYELSMLPLPVEHRRKLQGNKNSQQKSVSWTWRFSDGAKKERRALIRRQISGGQDDRLRQMIHSLRSVPGHRGLRDDVKSLFHYIHGQAKKHKVQMPELPTTISWFRPLSVSQVPLSTMVRRYEQGRATWFPAAVVGKSNIGLFATAAKLAAKEIDNADSSD